MPRVPILLSVLLSLSLPQLALAQGQQVYDGQNYPPAQGYPPAAPGYAPGYPNGYSQGYPSQPANQGSYPAPARAVARAAQNAHGMSVAQWFHNYDQIRHQAQMSAAERQRADTLLSQGFSILMPGDEKEATRRLLESMVTRYQRACNQLKQLPQLNQTAYLHHAYYNYFATAGQLFSDYLRVQNNLLITDATTGQPLATSLIQRKQNLESFEHECKQIDAQTRNKFGIAPYPW